MNNQRLCYSVIEKYHIQTCHKRTFFSAEQIGLDLTFSETPKTDFLALRSNYANEVTITPFGWHSSLHKTKKLDTFVWHELHVCYIIKRVSKHPIFWNLSQMRAVMISTSIDSYLLRLKV